jgi:hypothetical protein
MKGHKKNSKSHSIKRTRTQWTAQFLAAAELVRRGYAVAFTMGNHTPLSDLMVGSPRGKKFWIDVKGQSAKAAWLVRTKESHPNLFYLLVYAPPVERGRKKGADQYFVLTQAQTNRLVRRYARTHPKTKGTMPGFNWTHALPFENKWSSLPH